MSSPRGAEVRNFAKILAAVVFVVILVAALLLIFVARPSLPGAAKPRPNQVQGRTVTVTREVTYAPPTPTPTVTPLPQAVKVTTTTVDAAPDVSIWNRAVTPAVIPLLQVGLAVLTAFLGAAVAQRVVLGFYGLKIGPLEVPELPPVTAAELRQAVDVIGYPPALSPLLEPSVARGPQPFPQFMLIEGDREQLASVRVEVEEWLRRLAQEVGIDEELALDKILRRLMARGVVTLEARSGLLEFLKLGDRILAGARVEPQAAAAIREQALSVIYALMELTARARQAEGRLGQQ